MYTRLNHQPNLKLKAIIQRPESDILYVASVIYTEYTIKMFQKYL